MAQGYNDRLDESLGMRRGPERDFKQSYKDRRDESRGMRRKDSRGTDRRESRGSTFDLRDNTQASEVKKVPTDSEKYDMGRIEEYSCGSKGYPAEAWNYDY